MKRSTLIRILGTVLLLGAIAWTLAHRDSIDAEAIGAWLDGLGVWAAPVFVLIYAIGAMLFFPASVLTLAGGAVFGPFLGTALNLAGATLGATGAFLIARNLGGEWIETRIGERGAELMDGVEREGWRFVAFVRLVPVFPYGLLNYALGLTRIGVLPYALTTAICMAPGAAAFTYLGYAGREAMQGSGTAIRAGMVGLGLLGVAVVALPRVGRRLRRG